MQVSKLVLGFVFLLVPFGAFAKAKPFDCKIAKYTQISDQNYKVEDYVLFPKDFPAQSDQLVVRELIRDQFLFRVEVAAGSIVMLSVIDTNTNLKRAITTTRMLGSAKNFAYAATALTDSFGQGFELICVNNPPVVR